MTSAINKRFLPNGQWEPEFPYFVVRPSPLAEWFALLFIYGKANPSKSTNLLLAGIPLSDIFKQNLFLIGFQEATFIFYKWLWERSSWWVNLQAGGALKSIKFNSPLVKPAQLLKRWSFMLTFPESPFLLLCALGIDTYFIASWPCLQTGSV